MEKPHKKLDAWQLCIDLVTAVYQATGKFPKEEKYSLTDQIRRAAGSIPSNISGRRCSNGAKREALREQAWVEDANDLAEKILTLSRDPALAQRLGANARHAALQFDRPGQVQAYHELFRELIGVV